MNLGSPQQPGAVRQHHHQPQVGADCFSLSQSSQLWKLLYFGAEPWSWAQPGSLCAVPAHFASHTQRGACWLWALHRNLPTSSSHLCCISISLSPELPATTANHKLSLQVMLALARELHFGFDFFYLSPHSSHPLFTICILEMLIHPKYFYNSL